MLYIITYEHNKIKATVEDVKWFYEYVLRPQNTLQGGLGIIEPISSLSLCLTGGDQMMSQCIIRKSLG